jgi:hypothetical protein
MNDQYDFELGKARLELDRMKTLIDANKGKEDPQLKAVMAQQELTHKERVHRQKMRQQMQSDAVKAQREAQRAAQRAAQPSPGVK